jgi:hypothetical protein
MPSNFSELRPSTRQLRCLSIHRHRHRHKFSTLDFDRLIAITDRHKFVHDSSDRYTDRLSSNTETRRTHSCDLRSVSHVYFLTRSRLRYAHRLYGNCTETEADTRLGYRSGHRSHPLIPVISSPTSPPRWSELGLRTIRRYVRNV